MFTDACPVLPYGSIRLRPTVRYDKDVLDTKGQPLHGRAKHRASLGSSVRSNARRQTDSEELEGIVDTLAIARNKDNSAYKARLTGKGVDVCLSVAMKSEHAIPRSKTLSI